MRTLDTEYDRKIVQNYKWMKTRTRWMNECNNSRAHTQSKIRDVKNYAVKWMCTVWSMIERISSNVPADRFPLNRTESNSNSNSSTQRQYVQHAMQTKSRSSSNSIIQTNPHSRSSLDCNKALYHLVVSGVSTYALDNIFIVVRHILLQILFYDGLFVEFFAHFVRALALVDSLTRRGWNGTVLTVLFFLFSCRLPSHCLYKRQRWVRSKWKLTKRIKWRGGGIQRVRQHLISEIWK